MHRFGRRVGWRVVAACLAVLLVSGLLGPLAAGPARAQGIDPVRILTHYRLVVGDAGGLRLGDPITRAEMAVLAVRVLGLQEAALLARGSVPFRDAAGHWAAGEIAVISQRGIVRGYPDGTFGPSRNVTYAEMLTIILRLVGREPAGTAWPAGVLETATRLGLVPPGLSLSAAANAPAIRQHVFHALATAITTVPDATGVTLMQKYIDATPPILTVTPLPATTFAERVTVQGTAADAEEVVVNGRPVTLEGGFFQVPVDLNLGANTITVAAVDLAGNRAEQTFTVTRMGSVARIELSGPSQVITGTTAQYTVRAYDAAGTEIVNPALQARVEGSIGQFNLSTGRFVAGSTPGSGRLVVSAGSVEASVDIQVVGQSPGARRLRIIPPNDGLPLELNESYTVTVEVLGEGGVRQVNDYGREVSLTASGLPGAVVTPRTATTEAGVATFTVSGTVAGKLTLNASSPGLQSEPLTVTLATPVRIRLSALPEVLEPDGTSLATIRAELIDPRGAPVVNDSGSDVVIKLSAAGGGTLLQDTLIIPAGHSSSAGYDAELQAGTTNKSEVRITGSILSGHRYTLMEPLVVRVSSPTLADARTLQAAARLSRVAPGNEAVITVQVLTEDGRLVQEGSVAFQLAIATEDNAPKVNGIPAGMTVRLGDTQLNPVDDGIAEGAAGDTDDVVARTVDGTATIRITYYRSDTVTVTPILKGAVQTAYDSAGTAGPAAAAAGLKAEAAKVVFADEPAGLRLVAVQPGVAGGEHRVGSLRSSTSSSLTLRAYLVDPSGHPTSGTARTLRLVRAGGSGTAPVTTPNRYTCTTTGGGCEFTLTGTATPGWDEYKVVEEASGSGSGSLQESNIVRVHVTKDPPPPLTLNGIYGAMEADGDLLPRGTPVGPEHPYLLFDLSAPAGFTGAAAVYVYQEGRTTPVAVSQVIDFGDEPNPLVAVPRSQVSAGYGQRFYVVAHNAMGPGPRSNTVAIDVPKAANVAITRAYYNAANATVTIQGTGFATDAIVDPGRITLASEATGDAVDLGAGRVSIKSGTITVAFDRNDPRAQAVLKMLDDPRSLPAPVRIRTGTGWYTAKNGDLAPAETEGKPVTPMATIAAVLFDRVGSRLILKGAGFTEGTLDAGKLTITDGQQPSIALGGQAASRTSDTEYVVSLSASLKDKIQLLDGGKAVLHAQTGWFKDGSHLRGELKDIPVRVRVTVTGVSYDKDSQVLTITGSGFSPGGTVDLSMLRIQDRSDPSAAPLQLVAADGSQTVRPKNSTTIEVKLDPAVAQALATYQWAFLQTTADGWYVDEQGLWAPALPNPGILLHIP